MRPIIYLDSAKLHLFRHGHPWIYPKAITKKKGLLSDGELVDIADDLGSVVGTGVYNSHSLYRVRVLSRANDSVDATSLETIIQDRLQQAIMLRTCLHLPSEETTAYRLCSSEADGLSGLTIDRFNQCCVVSSSAYWVEQHKTMIMDCLSACLPHDRILWLPQIKALAQDGFVAEKPILPACVETIVEAGVYYQIDFSASQKTGLFLDQRENHMRIAALAKGKKVLDLYSYTGGFALHAAKAGASYVTAVDSSAHAIMLAKQNAELNQCHQIHFIEADAREYLDKAGEYDIVILDPPKLVPSRKHLSQAKNYYRFLHREVFKHMRKGALLMTCNCSSALSDQAFSELVCTQALLENKEARILGVFGPASCHPRLPGFPEGNYLTAVLLAIV